MKRRVLLGSLLGLAIVVVGGAAALAWHPAMSPIDAVPRFAPEAVARGAQLAAIGDCAVCHTGAAPYAGGRPVQTPFGAIYASNITPDRGAGIGTWSEAAFHRAMTAGISRDGHHLYPAFPYNHYIGLTDADISDLYAFIMTRAPNPTPAPPTRLPFPFGIRAAMAGWNLLFLHPMPATADRGQYLIDSLGHCGACHTPRNALGAEIADRAYTGGQADGWDAPGLTAASSPAAVAWSATALHDFLKNGEDDVHAAAAGPMHPVSHNLRTVDDADVWAMARAVASMTDPAGTAPADRAATVARLVARAAAPSSAVQAMPGATVFAGACAGCHGDGAPMMLDGRPSLALGSSVAAPSPRNAIQTLLHGVQPAPGERGAFMPAFAPVLSDAELTAVLAYLRARFSDRPGWDDLPAAVQSIRSEGGAS